MMALEAAKKDSKTVTGRLKKKKKGEKKDAIALCVPVKKEERKWFKRGRQSR